MVERMTRHNATSVQRWTRIAILTVGITTFLCYLALSPVLRTFTKQDRAGSIQQIGVGTVEQIVPPHIEENYKPIPTQVWVRVHGKLAATEAVFGSAQLHVGGQAQVLYRVGKSGRVYVDRVEPLPETAPVPQNK